MIIQLKLLISFARHLLISIPIILIPSGCISLVHDNNGIPQCQIQNFIFSYPNNFKIAKLSSPQSIDPELDYFYKAKILVENNPNLTKADLTDFEIGKHPAIMIFVKPFDNYGPVSERLDRVAKDNLSEKVNIGDYIVYRYYDYRMGPGGKKVYYYQIPISDSEILTFIAPKMINSNEKSELKNTNYNSVIEDIIKTLRINPDKDSRTNEASPNRSTVR